MTIKTQSGELVAFDGKKLVLYASVDEYIKHLEHERKLDTVFTVVIDGVKTSNPIRNHERIMELIGKCPNDRITSELERYFEMRKKAGL
jgi:hypothetical protein